MLHVFLHCDKLTIIEFECKIYYKQLLEDFTQMQDVMFWILFIFSKEKKIKKGTICKPFLINTVSVSSYFKT